MGLISQTFRAQVVLDLLRDADVVTPANYTGASLDKMALAKTLKYAASVAAERGKVWMTTPTPPEVPVPRAPTDDELCKFLMQDLCAYVVGMHQHQKQQNGEKAGAAAAIAAAVAETDAEMKDMF